ncbi:unnamed protein product [Boreogadus saida]
MKPSRCCKAVRFDSVEESRAAGSQQGRGHGGRRLLGKGHVGVASPHAGDQELYGAVMAEYPASLLARDAGNMPHILGPLAVFQPTLSPSSTPPPRTQARGERLRS